MKEWTAFLILHPSSIRMNCASEGETDSLISKFAAAQGAVKTALLSVLILFMLLAVAAAQAPKLSDAPKAIQDLSASIQGKPSDEMRALIVERFGPPQREGGSGIRIEQWDTSDGVLTFSPASAPTFSDSKTKAYFRLLPTKSPAATSILESYEMATLPDSAHHGSRAWLGNVKFGPNSSYRFIDSRQFPKERAAQTENFFMLHPTGTVEVHYDAAMTPDTLLESLPEGAVVAQLVFTSADHKHRGTFFITSSERDRRLIFHADNPLPYYMDSGWKSFWQ